MGLWTYRRYTDNDRMDLYVTAGIKQQTIQIQKIVDVEVFLLRLFQLNETIFY